MSNFQSQRSQSSPHTILHPSVWVTQAVFSLGTRLWDLRFDIYSRAFLKGRRKTFAEETKLERGAGVSGAASLSPRGGDCGAGLPQLDFHISGWVSEACIHLKPFLAQLWFIISIFFRSKLNMNYKKYNIFFLRSWNLVSKLKIISWGKSNIISK